MKKFSIQVTSIDVYRGRMVVRLSVGGDATTTSDIAARVLKDRPHLAYHACKNDRGPLFGDVIDSTSIPHLLEHLLIDEQLSKENPESTRSFVGNTEWTNKSEGEAKVEVSFSNDMVALTALADTLAYLDMLAEQL